jgi:hypothetical protein
MIEVAMVMGLVATVGLVRGWFLGYPAARPEAPSLSAKEQAVVMAAADAMFPRGGALPLSGSEAGALRYVHESLSTSPTRIRLLLRLLFVFVEHGPWVVNFRARLTRQSPEQRVATLRSWAESPVYFLRVVFTSLRTIVSLAYLSDNRVVDGIGATPNTAPFEGHKKAVLA